MNKREREGGWWWFGERAEERENQHICCVAMRCVVCVVCVCVKKKHVKKNRDYRCIGSGEVVVWKVYAYEGRYRTFVIKMIMY